MVNKADKEVNDVYDKYKSTVNMTFTELKIWSQNPASKLASQDRSPLSRNLRLLGKPKGKWNMRDVDDARKTISFISRMKKVKRGKKVKGKLSKRDIALLNWGFDPFKAKNSKPTKAPAPQKLRLKRLIDIYNKR